MELPLPDCCDACLQGRGHHHLMDDAAAGTSADPNSDLMFMSMAPYSMPVSHLQCASPFVSSIYSL